MVFSVVVWAGWIVVTRAQGSTLAPVDTSILRIIVPALLLCPVWLRRGIVPKGQPQLAMWIMAAGWGAPFILLISKGLETVPAALFGPMVPATLPLLVLAAVRAARRMGRATPAHSGTRRSCRRRYTSSRRPRCRRGWREE